MSDQLTAFFYLLLRDHLPAGDVAKIMREVDSLAGLQPKFSTPELEQMARRYSERLAEDVTQEIKLADEATLEHKVVD